MEEKRKSTASTEHAALIAEVALEEIATRFSTYRLTLAQQHEEAKKDLARQAALAEAAAAKRALEAEQRAARATFEASFAHEAAHEATRARHAQELEAAVEEAKRVTRFEYEREKAEAERKAAEIAAASTESQEQAMLSFSITHWTRLSFRTGMHMWADRAQERSKLRRISRVAIQILTNSQTRHAMNSWKDYVQSSLLSLRRVSFAVRRWHWGSLRGCWNEWHDVIIEMAQRARVLARCSSVFRGDLRLLRRACNTWRVACASVRKLRRCAQALMHVRELRALITWVKAVSERRVQLAYQRKAARRMIGVSNEHFSRVTKCKAFDMVARAAYRGRFACLWEPADPRAEVADRHRALYNAWRRLNQELRYERVALMHFRAFRRARACQAMRLLEAFARAKKQLESGCLVVTKLTNKKRLRRAFNRFDFGAHFCRECRRLTMESLRHRFRLRILSWRHFAATRRRSSANHLRARDRWAQTKAHHALRLLWHSSNARSLDEMRIQSALYHRLAAERLRAHGALRRLRQHSRAKWLDLMRIEKARDHRLATELGRWTSWLRVHGRQLRHWTWLSTRAVQHYASRTRQRGVGIWSQHAFTKKGEMRQGIRLDAIGITHEHRYLLRSAIYRWLNVRESMLDRKSRRIAQQAERRHQAHGLNFVRDQLRKELERVCTPTVTPKSVGEDARSSASKPSRNFRKELIDFAMREFM